jgi:hypothetical protein
VIVAFDVSVSVDADWLAYELYGAYIMANRFLRWDKSTSADVVGYSVRAKKDVDPVDSDPAYPAGNVDFVDLTQIPFLANADGDYHFSVNAIDDVGLESKHAQVSGPLDFVPPDAPTNLRLTES